MYSKASGGMGIIDTRKEKRKQGMNTNSSWIEPLMAGRLYIGKFHRGWHCAREKMSLEMLSISHYTVARVSDIRKEWTHTQPDQCGRSSAYHYRWPKSLASNTNSSRPPEESGLGGIRNLYVTTSFKAADARAGRVANALVTLGNSFSSTGHLKMSCRGRSLESASARRELQTEYHCRVRNASTWDTKYLLME